MKNIFRKFIQGYADFIIERLQTAQSEDDFNTWYTLGLYLDSFCQRKGIELQ